MMAAARLKSPILLLFAALLVSGCGVASSYRPADQKTIRDFPGIRPYQKKIGVAALRNNTLFTSDQAAQPFLSALLENMESSVSKAIFLVPGKTEAPSFLWNPPRIGNGQLDVFALSGLARREGLNAVVSPILMDIRVHSHKTGFWIFRDMEHSLQIQTAAALYDAFTGTRLALGILTDEIDIDEQEATRIRGGEEVILDGLAEIVEEMGEALGERMGEAIDESQWLAAVIGIEGGAGVISAGSDVGIQAGDRFAVLDASGVLTGLDGQQFIVPGVKIGEIVVRQVMPGRSLGTPENGDLPPVGSILVPE
jgi:hypothetical protein